MGEAIPGVVTPLGWSLWGPSVEVGIRDCYARAGALPRHEVLVPESVDDRLISVFLGRGALNVNFLCRMGANMPGSAPDAIARQLLGEVPAGIPMARERGRLPAVAVKLPYLQATVRRDVLKRTAGVQRWWRDRVVGIDALELSAARNLLVEARTCFKEMIRVQAAGLFIAVQSVYDRLLALIDQANLDPTQANALVAGQGSHAETALIHDLWSLGRGELSLQNFLLEHGYHGPYEGEVSAKVWREDPSPVRKLAEQYATMDDNADPASNAAERGRARQEAERALIGSLPLLQRPGARLVLRAAVSRIPLRGVAKAAFLQALDVARGAARQMGHHLADRGVLSAPEDVFYLTADELTGGLPDSPTQLITERRAQRKEFEGITLPNHWRGNPAPVAEVAESTDANRVEVRGIGASGGVVEGVIRVVEDPAFTEVESDEVLVCGTTDPSWASVLFLSSALVVDVGGLLSHAAVVAREVGVPCVIGTGNGTRVLRTGDRVRVDGDAGTVELLSTKHGSEGERESGK
ncbi:PEP-utilizing enzyme [Halopolyspora algeriensis]|uniref:PEP-utilizing enzyme n=1 Tax=Halopolyspora algeriensis TaxID=1500506 RepID=UPI001FE5C2F2|nr:PEP-utilizing enzyme [Halopolyspora algeriensis]